ncbi:MAG TPA: ABC transporter ATP-binding protein [Bryobacteraceae bacterium]|nr:ABC transporter ATP-binding protein [Bryobacteraceae bacterium]
MVKTASNKESPFSRRVLQVLLQLAREHKRQFVIIAVYSFLFTAADLIQPLIYKRAINDVAGLFVQPGGSGQIRSRTPEETLVTLIASVTLLFLISVVGYFFLLRARLHGVRVANDMESSLIVGTFGHVLRLPLSFFSHRASAGLAKRIDQSDQVSPIVSAFSQQIAPEAVRLVGICAIMLTQNWQMALVSTCTLPIYLWVARRSALRLQTGLQPYYELWENISARITDAISAVKTVKLSGAEAREEKRLRDESIYAYDVYLKRTATAQRYYIGQSLLSNLSKSLVLGFGGWLVLRHQLTPGDVVMFVAYLDKLYGPIDSLNDIAASLQNHTSSLQRAVELLDSGGAEPTGPSIPPGPGAVEFRDVHFGYVPEREVLRGVNLTLRPGRITVLAGPSGAGKTTTADLLLKLYEPWSGEMYLDGHPLSGAGPSAVREAIGVVAANGAVFRGSLRYNICYKRPQATDAEVLAAAFAAGLERTLERLPDGLATEIGEQGLGLSVGEQQRLQIARILVDRPRLLVLDEATANLDYATEAELKLALTRLTPRPTMLVIAHRYTMMRDADYVYIMRDGSVIEEGTPAQLATAGGWYAEMAAQSGETPEAELA